MTARKPIRLAIHVGPHKTGSTSVQRALAAARDSLAGQGVWYPPSLPGASWPDQHADAWILLRDGRLAEFDRWLAASGDEARQRGCDTLLLSSENFHVPRTRPPLAAAAERHRRATGGDVRYVFVRRDIVDLARSRALSHISGEAGFYFFHRYDLRRWACHYAIVQVRNERWFARRATRFVGLADGPREALAARVRFVAAPKRVFAGRVVRSGNVLDADDRTLSVWVELDAPEDLVLQHNMLARISLPLTASAPELAVPLTAIVEQGTQAHVFVRRADGVFVRRHVERGRSDDRHVAITAGLEPGDVVVVVGAAELQTGFAAIR